MVTAKFEPVWITHAARTPLGKFAGTLSQVSAPALAAAVLGQFEDWADMRPDGVFLGQVLQAGVGQAPARQASRAAGIGDLVPVTTINKVCGSGMKSMMLSCDQIRLGSHDLIIAGGMENMSAAPYLQSRHLPKMGHGQIKDHMFLDGLENADDGELMGRFGERLASETKISRAQMDEWAAVSVSRAQQAQRLGYFDHEIVPTAGLLHDEIPPSIRLEKIPQLKPAFDPHGTITAANASAIADGAAAVVLMSAAQGERLGCSPLATVVGYREYAHEPQWFTTAPVYAIEALLHDLGWHKEDVDLWEINEAFAVVTLNAITCLGLDPKKVNVHGGACALGHPLGATGARVVVTLIHAMRLRQVRRGIAALCIGGGEATAIAIEIPEEAL
ncbi:thiolase family protein [Thaumasiovibrio subtropicus]|uniref:thiolase family protein n=1 Tax=Thaumasiovibrio subtropicus TaxID=1891207 RepID=UPI000B34D09F|nr:thiolase family protein [Thaumasiovibrio subtropicus]